MASETESTAGVEVVDVAALRRFLDGEHAEIRDEGRALLSRPDFALPPADLPQDEHREQVLEWLKTLADEGAVALGFPRAYGGEGNIAGSIAAFETLAFGDLSLLVKCGVHFGLFGGAVLHLGTKAHHDRYLADIVTLELPGCFAMTESGHGSDVQSLGTTATYDAETEEFVIDTPDLAARKDYIGNAALHGRMAAVFAQLVVGGESHGVHALLVPIREGRGKPAKGVEITDCGPKLGLKGVDNGRLSFDGVRVPRENLLDRYASVSPEGVYSSPIENPTRRFFTMVGTLVQGRVSVGGASISASKTALTIAVRHGLRRRQFGPPGGGEEVLLLDYRAHQRRLLPLLAKTYALLFSQHELVRRLDAAFSDDEHPERERRELETMAAGVKAIATWHATETIQTCREACGGLGYLAENRFAALKADTDVFTTFEGDNTVLLQLVAKSLLTDYRDEFGELDPLGMVGFVAGQVVERIIERSAARELVGRLWDDLTPSSEEEGDLASRDYQLALFAWREEHILSGLTRRLKGGVDAGADPFDVFNDCQDHVLLAARAHIDCVILNAFAEGVAGCGDEAQRELLGRVCDLYALATIEADRAWFQEHGRISSTRSKAVIRAVNRLCTELRPHAATLVDALGVPEAVLGEIGATVPG